MPWRDKSLPRNSTLYSWLAGWMPVPAVPNPFAPVASISFVYLGVRVNNVSQHGVLKSQWNQPSPARF